MLTVSEKNRVKMPASMSRSNCKSSGGVRSIVNTATRWGDWSSIAVTLLPFMSSTRRDEKAMKVVSRLTVNDGHRRISLESSVLRYTTTVVEFSTVLLLEAVSWYQADAEPLLSRRVISVISNVLTSTVSENVNNSWFVFMLRSNDTNSGGVISSVNSCTGIGSDRGRGTKGLSFWSRMAPCSSTRKVVFIEIANR